MKALEKAQAIYDLTMNTRCEEQVQYLFTKGIHELMTDLIDELNEINFRNCDNCKHWNKLEEGCELTYWQDYNSGYGFESKKDDFCSRYESK